MNFLHSHKMWAYNMPHLKYRAHSLSCIWTSLVVPVLNLLSQMKCQWENLDNTLAELCLEGNGAEGHLELDPEPSHESLQSSHTLGKVSKKMDEMQHILHWPVWNHSASVWKFISPAAFHHLSYLPSTSLHCFTADWQDKHPDHLTGTHFCLFMYLISYEQMKCES